MKLKELKESLNPQLVSALKRAYNKSGKNKKKFVELAKQETGLTSAGLRKGAVGEFVSTLVFEAVSAKPRKGDFYQMFRDEEPQMIAKVSGGAAYVKRPGSSAFDTIYFEFMKPGGTYRGRTLWVDSLSDS